VTSPRASQCASSRVARMPTPAATARLREDREEDREEKAPPKPLQSPGRLAHEPQPARQRAMPPLTCSQLLAWVSAMALRRQLACCSKQRRRCWWHGRRPRVRPASRATAVETCVPKAGAMHAARTGRAHAQRNLLARRAHAGGASARCGGERPRPRLRGERGLPAQSRSSRPVWHRRAIGAIGRRAGLLGRAAGAGRLSYTAAGSLACRGAEAP
jgi:hypothetical protein